MDNSSYVLLDGKIVGVAEITPEKHRFIGMWRPPVNPINNPKCDVMCLCGEIMRFRGQEVEHYKRGCFDMPQYATIAQNRLTEIETAAESIC